MDYQLNQAALYYHQFPRPGKISVTPTKKLDGAGDLALAYSPGVAAACQAIVTRPEHAGDLTAKSNLVGVITNGTAVLGLGNIGPLAAKPVMEGKGCLFKKFADIDVFDLELNESNPDKLIDAIAMLEPTLGGINLEDIKAPECFYIEKELQRRLNIPVFHDDQHGTAIIATAAILNALALVGKSIDAARLVCSGAGAAAIACLDLLVEHGLRREHIVVLDSRGVIYHGRDPDMEANKARYASHTAARTLCDALDHADVFLGCSSAGLLRPDMLLAMAPLPVILALANPEPEIMPELAKAVRPDCIIATGRSDYPNQVNNVLCFPYIFRGALDAGATRITPGMKKACVQAIAELTRAGKSGEVVTQYPDEDFELGENYIIPKPFDPRLLWTIAPAVAQAAMDDGVATRPIADMAAYRDRLRAGMLPSYQWMKPLLQRAKSDLKRIVFAEGEDERVLCAAIAVAEQKLGMPCVIGRRAVIQDRLARLASGIKEQALVEIIDLDDEPVHGMLAQIFLDRMQRNGVTAEQARHEVRINNTLAAALLCLREGYDAAVCGGIGSYASHLETLNRLHADAGTRASMNAVFQEGRAVFICDAGLNPAPSLEERAAVAVTAAEAARRFNIEPHLGLLAPAAAGTKDSDDAYEELAALKDMIEQHASSLRISPAVSFCDFTAAGGRNAPTAYRVEDMKPNVLIMPDAGMGNVLSNLLRTISDDAVTIGPVLLGDRSCVQVAGPSSNALDFVELAVLAAVL